MIRTTFSMELSEMAEFRESELISVEPITSLFSKFMMEWKIESKKDLGFRSEKSSSSEKSSI